MYSGSSLHYIKISTAIISKSVLVYSIDKLYYIVDKAVKHNVMYCENQYIGSFKTDYIICRVSEADYPNTVTYSYICVSIHSCTHSLSTCRWFYKAPVHLLDILADTKGKDKLLLQLGWS